MHYWWISVSVQPVLLFSWDSLEFGHFSGVCHIWSVVGRACSCSGNSNTCIYWHLAFFSKWVTYCTTVRGANVPTITCNLFICTYHKWTVVVMCTEHNDAIVCALPDDSAAGYLQLFCGIPVLCTLHLHWLLCAHIWGPQEFTLMAGEASSWTSNFTCRWCRCTFHMQIFKYFLQPLVSLGGWQCRSACGWCPTKLFQGQKCAVCHILQRICGNACDWAWCTCDSLKESSENSIYRHHLWRKAFMLKARCQHGVQNRLSCHLSKPFCSKYYVT